MWERSSENKPKEINLSVFLRRDAADPDPLWLYAVLGFAGVLDRSARYMRRYMA